MANEVDGTTKYKSWSVMQAVVGFGALLGFFANQAAWFAIAVFVPAAKDLSPGILAILNQGSGSLTTFAGIVIGYYFGSSKGSTDKDEATKKAADTAAKAMATAASATAATQATLDKVLTGTGSGGVPIVPKMAVPIQPAVHNDVQPSSGPSTQQLFEASAAHFERGDYSEEVFRATLHALEYTEADIDAAVLQYKPK